MYTRATLWKTINFILPVIILVNLFRAASHTATTRLMFYQAFMAEMFANSWLTHLVDTEKCWHSSGVMFVSMLVWSMLSPTAILLLAWVCLNNLQTEISVFHIHIFIPTESVFTLNKLTSQLLKLLCSIFISSSRASLKAHWFQHTIYHCGISCYSHTMCLPFTIATES